MWCCHAVMCCQFPTGRHLPLTVQYSGNPIQCLVNTGTGSSAVWISIIDNGWAMKEVRCHTMLHTWWRALLPPPVTQHQSDINTRQWSRILQRPGERGSVTEMSPTTQEHTSLKYNNISKPYLPSEWSNTRVPLPLSVTLSRSLGPSLSPPHF